MWSKTYQGMPRQGTARCRTFRIALASVISDIIFAGEIRAPKT